MKKTEGQSSLRNCVLIVVVAFVVAILAFILSLIANSNRISSQNGEYLEAATIQTAQRIDGLFADSLSDVQTAADVFEESLDNVEVEPAAAAEVLDLPQFDHTFFITPRGMAFKPDGTTGVATEKYYYTQGIQGSSGLCYIDDALFDGESVIAFFTPVKFAGRVSGIVVCAYRESTLAEYLAVDFAGQQMPTFLCEPDGKIIASTTPSESKSSKYIEDAFSGMTLDGATHEQLAADMQNVTAVSFTYKAPDGTSNAYATKLPSFDWIVMRMFPASVASSMVAEANKATTLLTGCLLGIAIVASVLLVRQSRKSAFYAVGKRDAKEHAMGTVPMAYKAPSRVDSVFASSLTKEIQAPDLSEQGKPEALSTEEVDCLGTKRLANEHERLKELDCQGTRILLVEDNAMATSIAKELLELTGAEVEHAKNGQQALDMLLDHDPGCYDIVLMDIQMPVMNGYDATRAIRSAANERPDLSSIPVIALSADMFADDIKSSQEAGMNDHIAKPLEVDTLVDMLQKWMA